jgi:hypothetical protein
MELEFINDSRNRALTRELSFTPLEVNFEDGSRMALDVTPTYERLEEDFEIYDDIVLPAGAAYEFTEYQVQVEDECARPYATCPFASPVFEMRNASLEATPTLVVGLPRGQRHFWRVRACAGTRCGDWSEVRYLDVASMPSGRRESARTPCAGITWPPVPPPSGAASIRRARRSPR